jgi:hypothetical protein
VRSLLNWYAVLLLACILLPYLLGVRPRDSRDWRHIVVVIAFLTWLMLGFGYLISR